MTDEKEWSNKRGSINISQIASSILLILFAIAILTSKKEGSWFLTSIEKTVEEAEFSKKLRKILEFHVLSAFIWLICSTLQFTMKKKGRLHKVLGISGMLSALCLSVSAISLCLQRSNELILKVLSQSERFLTVFHIIYIQLFGNLMVSFQTTSMITDSIVALCQSKFKKHGKLMEGYQIMRMINLSQRVIAKVLRCKLPFLTNEVNYSISCVIMGYVQWDLLVRKHPTSISLLPKFHVIISFVVLSIYPCVCRYIKYLNIHFISALLLGISQLDIM